MTDVPLPLEPVQPVPTGADLEAEYWAYLINAVHAAFDHSRAIGNADPRGVPGTLTWSKAYYGENPPKLGTHPSGWQT